MPDLFRIRPRTRIQVYIEYNTQKVYKMGLLNLDPNKFGLDHQVNEHAGRSYWTHLVPEAELVSSMEDGRGVEGQLALVLLHNVAQPASHPNQKHIFKMSTLHDPDKNLNTDPDLAFFFTLPGILNTVFFFTNNL